MNKDRIALPADPDDPEDFDVTEEGLETGLRGREVRITRTNLGLTQTEFARRYHISLGALRDWEQSRAMPPDHVIAYMRVIAAHPGLVAELVA